MIFPSVISVTEPIGSCYESIISDINSDITVFNGDYNGNYHKLTNYNLNYSKNYTGVFGKTGSNCIISNLSVTGEIDGKILWVVLWVKLPTEQKFRIVHLKAV